MDEGQTAAVLLHPIRTGRLWDTPAPAPCLHSPCIKCRCGHGRVPCRAADAGAILVSMLGTEDGAKQHNATTTAAEVGVWAEWTHQHNCYHLGNLQHMLCCSRSTDNTATPRQTAWQACSAPDLNAAGSAMESATHGIHTQLLILHATHTTVAQPHTAFAPGVTSHSQPQPVMLDTPSPLTIYTTSHDYSKEMQHMLPTHATINTKSKPQALHSRGLWRFLIPSDPSRIWGQSTCKAQPTDPCTTPLELVLTPGRMQKAARSCCYRSGGLMQS